MNTLDINSILQSGQNVTISVTTEQLRQALPPRLGRMPARGGKAARGRRPAHHQGGSRIRGRQRGNNP